MACRERPSASVPELIGVVSDWFGIALTPIQAQEVFDDAELRYEALPRNLGLRENPISEAGGFGVSRLP